MNYHLPIVQVSLKLLVAILCGGVIGLERELSHKPAGLRTNILICMGAALFTVTSRHIGGGAPYTDPARLVAQVVTGVGFIGAGVILHSSGSVTGLTTAATIFVITAVGIAIGDGMFGPAVLATSMIVCVLVLLRRVERFLLHRRGLYCYTFKTRDPASSLTKLHDLLAKEGLHLDNFSVRDAGEGQHEVSLIVLASLNENSRLIEGLQHLGTDLRVETHEGAH